MKRALVTGVSRGIGQAVAEMLLAEGWRVFGCSRTPAPIKHEAFTWRTIDIGLPHHVDWDLRRHIGDGPLDAVVHCAAEQGPIGPFLDNNLLAWTAALHTNLIGVAAVVKSTLPRLMQSDDARILLFSGGGAFNPRPRYSAYAASKAGVVSLMETLSDELRETSVTVNCVSPGFVLTGFDPYAPVLAHDPDGRIALSRAVACVRHLLGPETRGLTGRTVSAEFDDWESLDQTTIAAVNSSVMGTRYRHKISQVAALRRVAV